MGPQQPIIVVDGASIRPGSSVYHTKEHRVLWVAAISESSVRLRTIDRSAEVDRESFRTKVEDGTLLLEEPMPAPDEGQR